MSLDPCSLIPQVRGSAQPSGICPEVEDKGEGGGAAEATRSAGRWESGQGWARQHVLEDHRLLQRLGDVVTPPRALQAGDIGQGPETSLVVWVELLASCGRRQGCCPAVCNAQDSPHPLPRESTPQASVVSGLGSSAPDLHLWAILLLWPVDLGSCCDFCHCSHRCSQALGPPFS